jgi:hypothetical protein
VKLPAVVILWILATAPGPALAGSGWYLLAPPVMRDPAMPTQEWAFAPDWTRPHRLWEHLGSFDSAKKCEEARTLAREPAHEPRHMDARDKVDQLNADLRAAREPEFRAAFNALKRHYLEDLKRDESWRNALCISVDDPRLK